MEEIKKIETALEFLSSLFNVNGMDDYKRDIDWCLGLVRRYHKYEPQWTQYTVVRAFDVLNDKYRQCLRAAVRCREDGDDVMCKNYHIMANGFVSDMKKISILL